MIVGSKSSCITGIYEIPFLFPFDNKMHRKNRIIRVCIESITLKNLINNISISHIIKSGIYHLVSTHNIPYFIICFNPLFNH